jgi:hypothetical protein
VEQSLWSFVLSKRISIALLRPLPAPWQQRYDHNWLPPLVGLTQPTSEVKTTISKHFGELHDSRKEGMVEHKLLDMVTIARSVR